MKLRSQSKIEIDPPSDSPKQGQSVAPMAFKLGGYDEQELEMDELDAANGGDMSEVPSTMFHSVNYHIPQQEEVVMPQLPMPDVPPQEEVLQQPGPLGLVPQYQPSVISEKFNTQFYTGQVFDSKEVLVDTVKAFAKDHYFSVRVDGRSTIKCSRAKNSNSVAKESFKKTISRKEFSMACNCPFKITLSVLKNQKPKVALNAIFALHNHVCDLPSAAVLQQLRGRPIEKIVPLLAPAFAPLLKTGKSVPVSISRQIVSEYVSSSVDLTAKSLHNIVTAVATYIRSGKHTTQPLIESKNTLSQFDKYIKLDHATEACDTILKDVLTNSSGETSWVVLRLMEKLKKEDPEFDYRIHTEKDTDQIDAVCWQTGVHRAAFEKYGNILIFDTRKSDNMNSLGMKYMTLATVDGNNKFWPICHAFVFDEDHELYEFACTSALEMTPGRSKESVVLGYGDMFFEPERVKEWFPNIVMMIDSYHLAYAQNNQSILAKEFGPFVWDAVKKPFVDALNANTKDGCFMYLDKALEAVGSNQLARDKIIKWQNISDRWAHYRRNMIKGHRNIATSSYAEQNHASIARVAPDNHNRTLEQNIVDIMKRDEMLFSSRQKEKFLWYSLEAAHINNMTPERAKYLTDARKHLEEIPYKFFETQFQLSYSYIVRSDNRNGLDGYTLHHTSLPSGDGRFIGNGQRCTCADVVAMSMCRHEISMSRHMNENSFNVTNIDPALLQSTFINRTTRENVSNDEFQSELPTTMQYADPDNGSQQSNENYDDGKPDAVFDDLMCSPSKSCISSIDNTTMTRANADIKKSVGFQTLSNRAQEVATLTSQLCNSTQHIINTHLQELYELLKKGNYGDDEYKGKSIEAVAQILEQTSSDRNVFEKNMPKTRRPQRVGRKPVHRFGSAKSSHKWKTIRKCGFCKMQGATASNLHTTKASCPVKARYGMCTPVVQNRIRDVTKKVENIASGAVTDFLSVDLDRMKIDKVPDGTKRIQVIGYLLDQKGKTRYLFCTCIDDVGSILCRREGSATISYKGVYIEYTAILTSLRKLDYIFYAPSLAASLRDDLAIGEAEAKEEEGKKNVVLNYDNEEEVEM